MPNKKLLSLTSDSVEKILKKNNFTLSRKRGSHLQYVGYIKGIKRRVTVIANKRSFAPKTINTMIL
jgi:predicted RNA binding protein YcfA (HicA-like mRNA interferase family)